MAPLPWGVSFVAGFQFYTIDKCHNRRQSATILLAHKYRTTRWTAFHNCRLLQKLLRAHAEPCEKFARLQQGENADESGILVARGRDNVIVRCHVHLESWKLQWVPRRKSTIDWHSLTYTFPFLFPFHPSFAALHEQVFIVFMVCSLCHMLVVIKLCQLLKNEIDVQQLPHLILINEEKSIKLKKILFNISIVSTIGLAVFFFKHRVYCHDLAFSAFAFCEYVIAVCNLAFHCTTMLDFPSEYLMIARRTTKLKLKHPTGWKLDWIMYTTNDRLAAGVFKGIAYLQLERYMFRLAINTS